MHEYIVKQTEGKRMLAGFLDFLFVVFLAFFLFYPINALAENFDYDYMNTHKIKLIVAMHESKLYYTNEKGALVYVEEYAETPKALYGFYVDKVDENTGETKRGYSPILSEEKKGQSDVYNTEEDYYAYLQAASGEALFDFTVPRENGWDIKIIEGNESLAETFYMEQLEIAFTLFETHPEISALYLKTQYIDFILMVVLYLLSAVLLILLLPIVLPNGVTLGKLMTKTAIVRQNGYKMTRLHSFYRNFVMFLFSYVFVFLPFHLISMMMFIFSKKHQSLYDFITFTQVIEKEKSIIFKSEHDYLVYRKKLAQILIEQEKNKQKVQEEEINAKQNKN